LKLSFDSRIDPAFSKAIEVSLNQLNANHSVELDALEVGLTPESGNYLVSSSFNDNFSKRSFSHHEILGENGFVNREDDTIDRLSTIVYMLNYFQEVGAVDQDDLRRFPFAKSYQARFGVCTENQVLNLFREFVEEQYSKKVGTKPSRLFVSHDNDSLYGSFTKDGFYALKKGRLDWLLQIVWSEIMRNPRWMNMDQMMDINDEYDLKSTFFWIANNRPTPLKNRTLSNGDYQISSSRTQSIIQKIASRGFHQGLHKSVNSESFSTELEALPFKTISNRNHYLRLQIPEHFSKVDASPLEIDFSLGFAEEFGLRNNYALPIRPFDINRGEQCRALHVPLMVMDTSNWTYRKQDLSGLQTTLVELLDKHKEDAIISVLWHNKYFTNMKFDGYLEVYRAMLDFCRNNDIRPINQEEIFQQYASK
jgi:peptidoglycan/xylan/chitin deacetylase (PgdA/CDA1 family)